MTRWRNSASPLINMALPNSWFQELGLVSLDSFNVGILRRYYEKRLRFARSRVRGPYARFCERDNAAESYCGATLLDYIFPANKEPPEGSIFYYPVLMAAGCLSLLPAVLQSRFTLY